MKIIDVYKNAVKRLGEAGIENPAFDAKILFEHVFSLTYSDIGNGAYSRIPDISCGVVFARLTG